VVALSCICSAVAPASAVGPSQAEGWSPRHQRAKLVDLTRNGLRTPARSAASGSRHHPSGDFAYVTDAERGKHDLAVALIGKSAAGKSE
jgi:hypothetical protein